MNGNFADFDQCTSNPCQNNGTCKDLAGRFKCNCVFGYGGKNGTCEVQIGTYAVQASTLN